jgi:hypothetical protein
MILIHIKRYSCVHGHTQQRGIRKCDHESAPDPKRPEQMQNPRRVPRQNVSDGFQRKLSLRESRSPFTKPKHFVGVHR